MLIGASLGSAPGRQLLQHSLKALGHELARAVDVSPVLKLDRHLREAELRQRTHFVHAGQAGQSNFDRLRDEFFRLFGSKCRDFGVHLHLRSRNVGHGIDRQMQCRPETYGEQDDQRPAG